MPNTSYDNNLGAPNSLVDNGDQLSHAASEPAGDRKRGAYKKKGLKEYNQMMEAAANKKMGGLGANIGSEQWEIANRKKEIAR